MSRTTNDLPDAFGHRRRSSRQVRHEARQQLHQVAYDPDTIEDAELLCPTGHHDLGRHASPPPPKESKPGRRPGFKVWKTPFWKRRRSLWAARNEAQRRLT
jgi:hypothetical protein